MLQYRSYIDSRIVRKSGGRANRSATSSAIRLVNQISKMVFDNIFENVHHIYIYNIYMYKRIYYTMLLYDIPCHDQSQVHPQSDANGNQDNAVSTMYCDTLLVINCDTCASPSYLNLI